VFIEHPSGATVPLEVGTGSRVLSGYRVVSDSRVVSGSRVRVTSARPRDRERSLYFKGGTDRYTPWGARGVPVAALGFLKARKDTGNGHSAHTGTHTRDREQRLTPPPTRRAPVVAGELRRVTLQPQRPACVRSLARDPPQSVSAASRPIRPNRPSPRMTGVGMRCPAGQDSQRPRRGRGSP
jgi:hypothetical protein